MGSPSLFGNGVLSAYAFQSALCAGVTIVVQRMEMSDIATRIPSCGTVFGFTGVTRCRMYGPDPFRERVVPPMDPLPSEMIGPSLTIMVGAASFKAEHDFMPRSKVPDGSIEAGLVPPPIATGGPLSS